MVEGRGSAQSPGPIAPFANIVQRVMFLKNLVIRGFKSFADKTVLDFEPGVSIIVGPNGSGKSNIIDSISWVLGEQGPRSLRGGKMEDVIYAGSRLRPALGMAEVTMTIDNSSGLLPIDFTEVTISRTLFRNGESEYRLNGTQCRLLDIAEILSDTGIGREQHTIIGQGQLDQVLTADPIQMRGFIEEAAGIAKHRRRKDRALRKIAATEQNLLRLSDLLSEIRRQLRPLREQAEVAKKHAALAEELGRIRLVSSARELKDLREKLGPSGSLDLDAPIRQKETELRDIETTLTELEKTRTEIFARAEAERDAAWSLSRALERLSNVTRLAAERRRTLEAELGTTTEASARARVAEITRELKSSEATLEISKKEEKASEDLYMNKKGALDEASRAALAAEAVLTPIRSRQRDATSEAVRIRGEKAALEASIDAIEKERSRAAGREMGLKDSLWKASSRLEEARRESLGLEGEEAPIVAEIEERDAEIAGLDREMSLIQGGLKEAEREWYGWQARAEVRGGSGELASRLAAESIPGVIGILSQLVNARSEGLKLLTAYAGRPEAVLVVESASVAALVSRRSGQDGRIGILTPSESRPVVHGARPLLDSLEVLNPAVESALAGVFEASSVEEAVRLAGSNRGATFVTLDGAVATGSLLALGPAEAGDIAERAKQRVEELRRSESEVFSKLEVARRKKEEALGKLNEIDASMAAVSERVSGAEREVHALERELTVVSEQRAQADSSRGNVVEKMQSSSALLPEVEATIRELSAEIEALQKEHAVAAAATESLAAEAEEARMELTRVSERRRLVEERLAALRSALADAQHAAGSVEGKRRAIQAMIEQVAEVAAVAHSLVEGASDWAEDAESAYQESREELNGLDSQVGELRVERAARAGALDDMRQRARQEDLQKSEIRIRARILEERLEEQWQIEPDRAVERFGHQWEADDPSRIEDPLGRIAATDADSLERRRARLERDLSTIGTVNPLAEQEFDSLTEREDFLTKQIADVRASRRDLFKITTEIDEQIREMFKGAFEDVASEYERLFATLFPGGQGRLRLTEPSDMLQTGVEVEARPGGKNLKRLSLLSGGEKALSALAVLFAIFRARPSPFYVLDEVEAALDDVNLHRFLGLLREFRSTSQLLVVTHQKRTMEAADVLYGVSIKPDGASRVIAEKLSDEWPKEDPATPRQWSASELTRPSDS